MIEIALSLAIIGFALIAILGVLPIGLGVQKDNREETIVDQDAVVWMNAIRNGSMGYDDLTNSVIAITNIVTTYRWDGNTAQQLGQPVTNAYTPTTSYLGQNLPMIPAVPLTNGMFIIGLLSKPKLEYSPDMSYLATPIPYSQPFNFVSNYTIAVVRAMSGSAVEKTPQDNADILSGAFAYRMIVEMAPYVPVDTNSIDLRFTNNLNTPQLYFDRINRAHMVWNLQTNSHNLRLTFRWPMLPTGDVGNGRATFRSLIGGQFFHVNYTTSNYQPPNTVDLYFLQPPVYSASLQAP